MGLDDGVEVREHPDPPARRVGRAGAGARDLRRRLRFVPGAERAVARVPRGVAGSRARSWWGARRARRRRSRRARSADRGGAPTLRSGYADPHGRGPVRRAPKFAAHAESRDPGWWSRGQHVRDASPRRSAPTSRSIERDIVGGAAHLWDCIPSKALIATGGELVELDRAHTMGLVGRGPPRHRRAPRAGGVDRGASPPADHHAARVAAGAGDPRPRRASRARTRSWSTPTACIEELSADFVLVATGSRPRVPEFVTVDRDRVLTTRDAYPPPEIPEHAIVIGSGVTGVEFTHLFDSLGRAGHAARVAPAGAADQGRRGRRGARGRVPRSGASRC